LTYTREPDGTWLDVEVHEVVDNARLEIVLDKIDDDVLADVDELHEGVILLVLLVQRLVDLLVVADTVAKVLGSVLWILPNVVW
jgi:hypothetical protein